MTVIDVSLDFCISTLSFRRPGKLIMRAPSSLSCKLSSFKSNSGCGVSIPMDSSIALQRMFSQKDQIPRERRVGVIAKIVAIYLHILVSYTNINTTWAPYCYTPKYGERSCNGVVTLSNQRCWAQKDKHARSFQTYSILRGRGAAPAVHFPKFSPGSTVFEYNFITCIGRARKLAATSKTPNGS